MGAESSQIDRDIFEINRVMLTYCWSLDSRDWARLATCFVDDMVFEASNMGRYDSAKALMGAFQSRTIRVPVRRHMITNPYVRVDGDSAEFTSYLQNIRIRTEAPGGDYFIGAGYYRNTLVRTAQGWKLKHLRFESTYMEGNARLDPSLPPMSYLPVMASPADAPWGGVARQGLDGDRSNSQQIKDLAIGAFRAIDAGAHREAATAFTSGATANVNGSAITGAAEIAAAFGAGGRVEHAFWNEKYAASGDKGVYCAYVYRTTGTDGGIRAHGGGVILMGVVKTAAGWRISEAEYIEFWTRGTEIKSDPIRTRSNYGRITTFPFQYDGNREALLDEDEVTALMSKYSWSYDFWNFTQVEECFVPDVEATFVTGNIARYTTRDAMIPGIKGNHEKQPYMQHYCTNFIVDLGVEPGTAEMKCYASSRRTEAGGGLVLVAGGRYDAYVRKVGGQWQFAAFTYTRVHGAYDGEQPRQIEAEPVRQRA